MPAADSTALLLRFGAFELDLQNSELRRAGVLLKLTPQQFQVLRLLADNAGQLQTREEIQREVWGTDTFVDFDRNLNVCVAQIRSTLNDDSDAPRFIQTVPKRGYRFIAPVERVGAPAEQPPLEPARRSASSSRTSLVVAAVTLIAAALVGAAYLRWRQPPPSNRVMIATLPFENLSGDANQDMFTDGLTEEIIGQLGSLNPQRLGVIGRSSVMRYKGAPRGIALVGRDLHVDYVVEGTVRESAGRIRIAARLIQVADQGQIWNDTLERAVDETFLIQEEVAAHIANAVSGNLLGGAPAASARSRTRSQAAYEAYLNGRYLQRKGNRADLERSIASFEQASKLDPQFDLAQSALAETYVSWGRSGGPPQETFPRARAAAEKALSLNEANAEAQNALANALFWHEWNWPAAEQHFTRAIAINPSFSLANHDYAFFLVAMGRTEPGLASLRRALAADPLSWRVNIDAGWLLLQAHHFDEAIKQARRAQELEPGLAEANACIVRARFHQKQYREVLDSMHVTGSNPEETLKRLYRDKLQEEEKSGKADPFTMATRYAFVGENAKALDSLDQAYARRSIMMPLLKTEPSLESLHGEPRFQEMVRKLALP
ncbi:MAG TPA: winged helix-turn-helix domain-containing protein [Bryobacteraceae bacterium]|nr:winged helix-turn-helix domain-containing protein [Bryobacteraceae bacterium]